MAIKYSDVTFGQMEAVLNKIHKTGGENAISRLLADELVVVERESIPAMTSKPALLAAVSSIEVSAVDRFVAADHFTTENTPDGVQLYRIGDNFRRNFLGKTEESVPALSLQKSRLAKNSLDKSILDELGSRAATTLAHLWELLKKQPKGPESGKGPLLTDGKANIFYIEDANGNVWAVCARWYSGGGWDVGADSVSYPGGWSADRAVFSR